MTARTSRDEGFRAWLAMNEYLLDEFLAVDVPSVPVDAYTEAGLAVAEAEAIQRFASIDELLAEPNRELYDKFVRFVGQTFVTGLGGAWTNKPFHDDGSAYLGVVFPWAEETLTIPTLVTSALARRTGSQWTFVYGNMQQDREAAGL